MKILYVTPLWSGLKDLIVDGMTNASGMPAFVRTLKELVARGHQVDMIVATPKEDLSYNVKAHWLRSVHVEMVPWHQQPWTDPPPRARPIVEGRQRLISMLRVVQAVRCALRRERYDFVYGQGQVGVIGCILAQRAGIPTGQRLYGVHELKSRLERRAAHFRLAIWSPLLYLSFRTSKAFLLVTDDGSQGEFAWQRLGRKGALDFYCWRNGADFRDLDVAATHRSEKAPFLFMPARLTAWKGQHLALEVLRDLHAMGHPEVQLILAGSVADSGYRARLDELREAYRLGTAVTYLGSLPAPALIPYYQQSLAVLALYDMANVGNVVIEAMSIGSVLVVRDSAVLDGVITDGEDGLRVQTPADAARRIAALLDDPVRADTLAAAAATSARRLFQSWDERVAREIDLIETSVRAGSLTWEEVSAVADAR